MPYTGYQFQAGTDVYYTFDTGYWSSYYSMYEITSSYFQSIVISAFEEWDDYLNFNFTYTTSASYADIVVGWQFIDGYGHTLGQQWSLDPDGNGIVSGDGEGISFIGMDDSDRYNAFTSTMKHEIGHALGLGHDSTSGSLMNPRLNGTETITGYDIAVAAGIYGYNTSGSSSANIANLSQTTDTYAANSGNDTVLGYGGNDVLYGNRGLDQLSGGEGNDTLYGGQNAGAYTGSPAAQRDGIETIVGGNGDDLIYGNHGGDILIGGVGDDSIFGGQDSDGIVGGPGNDYLHGNLGIDGFFYNVTAAENEGTDYIFGFSAGEDALSLGYGEVASEYVSDTSYVYNLNTGTVIVLVGVTDPGDDPFV